MSGPVDAYAILPDDSGNAGKKIRTQTTVVSGQTVHTHFFVKSRQAVLLGVYRVVNAQITAVASAQNGTSTGALWIHNPVATSNKKARIRRLIMTSQHSTVLATPTAPRLLVSRFTFGGTASGTQITTYSKMDSSYGTPILDIRSAMTGLTSVTLAGSVGAGPFCGALTAVGAWAPGQIDMVPAGEEDEWSILAPGEGIVIWQDTAGTSSDTRVANVSMLWDEIDTA